MRVEDASCAVPHEPVISTDGTVDTSLFVSWFEDGPGWSMVWGSVIATSSGLVKTYPCIHSDTVNGVRLCSSWDGVTPHVVGPVDDPSTRWPLGDHALFFACDPDGDGIQALCTGEGYDEPPFDGVLDHHWPEPVVLTHPIDRPGLPPLIGPWYELTPDVAAAANRQLRLSDSRIDGEPWIVVPSDRGHRAIRATADVETFDVRSSGDDRYLAVVGRFRDGADPWLVSLDKHDGLVKDLRGRTKGRVEHTADLERFGLKHLVGPDLDGDGINEIVMSNDAHVYIWRLVEQ